MIKKNPILDCKIVGGIPLILIYDTWYYLSRYNNPEIIELLSKELMDSLDNFTVSINSRKDIFKLYYRGLGLIEDNLSEIDTCSNTSNELLIFMITHQ